MSFLRQMYNMFTNWFKNIKVQNIFPAWLCDCWSAAQSNQHLKTIIAIHGFGHDLSAKAKYIPVTCPNMSKAYSDLIQGVLYHQKRSCVSRLLLSLRPLHSVMPMLLCQCPLHPTHTLKHTLKVRRKRNHFLLLFHLRQRASPESWHHQSLLDLSFFICGSLLMMKSNTIRR
jgi:hypothetical protein